MIFEFHKTRNICKRPMFKETYPKVSSKSNKKHRSYRNYNGYVKNENFWEFLALWDPIFQLFETILDESESSS